MNLTLLARILAVDLQAAHRRLRDLEAPASQETRAGGNDVDGDCAVATMNQEDSARRRASVLLRIRELQGAIRRCDDGSFGVCAACTQAIPAARLKARPTAELCVSCQASLEARATRALRGRGWVPEPEDDVPTDDALSGFPAANDRGEKW